MQRPRLNSLFLKEHPPSFEFFQKWKDKGPWSSSFLPIYEWNGVLFVASSEESASSTPSGVICVYVEAAPEALQRVWNQWVPSSKSKNPATDDPFLSLENISTGGHSDPSILLQDNPPKGAHSPNWVVPFFHQMKEHFEQSMVLLFDGNVLKPWSWSPGFSPSADTNSIIDVKSPSPFRIALTTQKPYHGPLFPNPVTEKFMSEWNEGKTPEHLTLVPLLLGEQIMGMILGLAAKTAYQREALACAESIGKEISQKIKNDPNSLKAA